MVPLTVNLLGIIIKNLIIDDIHLCLEFMDFVVLQKWQNQTVGGESARNYHIQHGKEIPRNLNLHRGSRTQNA